MNFVDNARHAWKWLSTQMLAITGVMPAVWIGLPEEWRSAVPPKALAITTVITAAIGIYGRVTKTKADPQ